MIDKLLDRITDLSESLLKRLMKTPPRALDSQEKIAEIVNYLIFGVLTTLVSLITYFIAARLLGNSGFTGEELQWRANVCQAFSWVCAVMFAFFTNKRYVFRSAKKKSGAAGEFFRFVLARVLSFLLIELGVFNLLLLLIRADSPCKLIVTVLVVIFNYFASKLAVFRKNKKRGEDL